MYCDEAATEIEHVRPLSAGGRDCRSNVAAACSGCNGERGNRSYAEWAATF
ncbi:HNH endonuclease [Streptomyces ovatisporus]|uniref:HNH endonuclease n=1 Tax=Streptomyces ovatisporus TaxID=1128682 RepID=A0ABV9A386_9ACTN